MYTVTCLNWGLQPNYAGALYPLCPTRNTLHNNGTLQNASFSHGGRSFTQFLTFNQTYSHNELNRLTESVETGNRVRGSDYDSFGKMWVDPVGDGRTYGIAPAGSAPTSNVFSLATNQMTPSASVSFDGRGNQSTIKGGSVTYDAESRMVQFVGGAAYGALAGGPLISGSRFSPSGGSDCSPKIKCIRAFASRRERDYRQSCQPKARRPCQRPARQLCSGGWGES